MTPPLPCPEAGVLPHAGPFEVSFPVVMVGAGAAGLVAALAARDAGAEVLVLERDATPRGSTALSAGLVPAAGTRWQAAAGVSDSPAQFARDVSAKAGGAPDPTLVRTVTDASGPALEWLHERHGIGFSLVTDFTYPGHSAYRMHGLPSRSGADLLDALRNAAEAAGALLLCGAHVTALVADGGTVTGVVVARPDGTTERVGCSALVLACSGYGGNKDLVREHIPALADALYFGHAGNQGDALRWGAALGAAVRDLPGHQGHGSVSHPSGILITWATITAGGVQVNARGLRFSDESRGYSEQAADVLRQPGGTAWAVFDARIAGIARQFADFRQAEALGVVLQAGDIATLAELMGVPSETLACTLAQAAAGRHGAACPFGRNFRRVPPLAPPYCAVRVTGALFHTQGGLVVDSTARVVRADGTPAPNLLAAGGAACGVSGPKPEGYLSGNGLLTAVALGRIAGAEAAATAGSTINRQS